jgi:hypothetical protein
LDRQNTYPSASWVIIPLDVSLINNTPPLVDGEYAETDVQVEECYPQHAKEDSCILNTLNMSRDVGLTFYSMFVIFIKSSIMHHVFVSFARSASSLMLVVHASSILQILLCCLGKYQVAMWEQKKHSRSPPINLSFSISSKRKMKRPWAVERDKSAVFIYWHCSSFMSFSCSKRRSPPTTWTNQQYHRYHHQNRCCVAMMEIWCASSTVACDRHMKNVVD